MRLTPITTAIWRACESDVYPMQENPPPHHAQVCIRGILSEDLNAAAAALDLPAQALKRELPGRSLAEVALARGLDPAVVADALFARALLAIARGVEAEVISAEQSLELAHRVRETIDWRVHRPVSSATHSVDA